MAGLGAIHGANGKTVPTGIFMTGDVELIFSVGLNLFSNSEGGNAYKRHAPASKRFPGLC